MMKSKAQERKLFLDDCKHVIRVVEGLFEVCVCTLLYYSIWARCYRNTYMPAYYGEGKLVAAICAAPTVFGKLGLLEGKKAICYPGMEDQLTGAIVTYEPAVRDGNIITSRGMGTAIDFGLEILAYYEGRDETAAMAEKVVYEA